MLKYSKIVPLILISSSPLTLTTDVFSSNTNFLKEEEQKIRSMSITHSNSFNEEEGYNSEALYTIGLNSLKEKRYNDAFINFKKAAELGDPRAQCQLGSLYTHKNHGACPVDVALPMFFWQDVRYANKETRSLRLSM